MSTIEHAPSAGTNDTPARDLEELRERLEAHLKELTTARPAGDAAGSDVAEEMRSFLEEALEGPEGEMVS